MGSSSKTVLGAAGTPMVLACLAAVHCGGATNERCVPGATQVCVGPGACMGGQACRNDGTGFDPCVCGAPFDAGVDVSAGGSSSGGSGSGSEAGSSSGSVPEAGPWDCLNDPNQTFQAGAMATVKVLAMDGLQPILSAEDVDGGSGLDAIQYTPLMGISIRACPYALDSKCAAGSAWETVDSTGAATFVLPQSFTGFFELSGPNLFTTSLLPGNFVAGDTNFSLSAPLLQQSGFQAFEQTLPGVTVDTDTDGGIGHVFLSVFDCNDHRAPGVVFVPGSVAPPTSAYATTIFYTQGQGLMEFPSTQASATDHAGVGGVLNVPVGGFSVKATLLPSGQQIAVVDTLVSPGVATLAYIRVRTH